MATGDHDWTAGEQVTAANMDDYLQLQVVQQFATAAARDSALSARKREGMVTYQLDTNTLTVYSGSAWSTIGPAHGQWIDFTPTLVVGVTVTKTVTYARYMRVGRKITAQCLLTATSSGSASTQIAIGIPITASTALVPVGAFFYQDTGTAIYAGISTLATTTVVSGNSNGSTAYMGQNGPAVTVVSGDIIGYEITYEAAADA